MARDIDKIVQIAERACRTLDRIAKSSSKLSRALRRGDGKAK